MGVWITGLHPLDKGPRIATLTWGLPIDEGRGRWRDKSVHPSRIVISAKRADPDLIFLWRVMRRDPVTELETLRRLGSAIAMETLPSLSLVERDGLPIGGRVQVSHKGLLARSLGLWLREIFWLEVKPKRRKE